MCRNSINNGNANDSSISTRTMGGNDKDYDGNDNEHNAK